MTRMPLPPPSSNSLSHPSPDPDGLPGQDVPVQEGGPGCPGGHRAPRRRQVLHHHLGFCVGEGIKGGAPADSVPRGAPHAGQGNLKPEPQGWRRGRACSNANGSASAACECRPDWTACAARADSRARGPACVRGGGGAAAPALDRCGRRARVGRGARRCKRCLLDHARHLPACQRDHPLHGLHAHLEAQRHRCVGVERRMRGPAGRPARGAGHFPRSGLCSPDAVPRRGALQRRARLRACRPRR